MEALIEGSRLNNNQTNKEQLPDVCRSTYSTQRLHSRMQVLRVLGVGDEHGRPVLKPQVREAQQVVVKGQNSVPGDKCETGYLQASPSLI